MSQFLSRHQSTGSAKGVVGLVKQNKIQISVQSVLGIEIRCFGIYYSKTLINKFVVNST